MRWMPWNPWKRVGAGRAGEKLRTQAKVTAAVAAVEQGRVEALRSLLALARHWSPTCAQPLATVPRVMDRCRSWRSHASLVGLRERLEHLQPLASRRNSRCGRAAGERRLRLHDVAKAVVEELTARCEAVRWRILALDPAQWRDFGKAIDPQAVAQAETGHGGR